MVIKVESINIGKYDVDSVIADINGQKTEVCFDKKENIAQYLGQEVSLGKKNGRYVIEHNIPKPTGASKAKYAPPKAKV